MKTVHLTNEEALQQHQWYVIDAQGKALGRLASEIAKRLRGKHKPTFSPHVDVGDFIVVINAAKVLMTGRKLDQKMHREHSGYPAGLKEYSYRWLLQHRPERVIELAVRGMLPRTPLGRRMFRKLKVYAGPQHPHQAQQPIELPLDL